MIDNSRKNINCNNKNAGIEILRILAMLMVVTLHVLGTGGALNNVQMLTKKYMFLWLWETCCYGAVNCFALISGYVMWNRNHSYKKWFVFWLEIYLLTFVTYLFTRMLGWHEIGLLGMLNGSIPYNGNYWYVRSYLGVMVLIPVMNAFLQKADIDIMKKIGIMSFLVFTIVPLVNHRSADILNGGYGVLWLSVCYIWGGIINKCSIENRLKPMIWLGISIASTIIAWSGKILCEKMYYDRNGVYEANTAIVSYISPFIVCAAVSLFCCCARISVRVPKCFFYVSGSVFGVYIVHFHNVIRVKCVEGKWADCVNEAAIEMYGHLFLGVIEIFITSLIFSMISMFFIRKIMNILGRRILNNK